MQNDMLKNTIAPWQEKGRWYHAKVSCNGTKWNLIKDESDPHFANLQITSNNYLVVSNNPEEMPIDFAFIPTDKLPVTIVYYPSVYWGPVRNDIILPSPVNLGGTIADVYIYIVKVK